MLSLIRYTFAFFLLLSFCGTHAAYAQNNLITIDATNQPLKAILKTIADQSGREFAYNPRRVDEDQLVSYKVSSKPVHEVLQELCSLIGAEFELIENQIILKPAYQTSRPVDRTGKPTNAGMKLQRNFTLNGYVRDAATGEALIGATVLIKELQSGGIANSYGFFSITIPEGIYEVICSFVGFQDQVSALTLNSDIQRDIRLTEEAPVLPELLITGTTTEVTEDIKVLQTSSATILPEAIEERPSFFGEADVVKSLEAIPGVKMHADGSTFYYVRGGHRDQNVIMIDDAPVYNPSHLLGVFSTVIPDAVQDMRLYRGEMPASFGGRISSLLDVRTKKGNDQQFEAWGSIGLLSNKVGIEGPFVKDRSSYLLSTRFSRLKWLTQLGNNDIQKFQFYDITAKMNFRAGNRDRFHVSWYNGGDEYFNSNVGISWTNTAASVRWNRIVNEKLFMNTTLAAGNYDYFLYADVWTGTKWNSHISNANLKTDFSYFINPKNEVMFGIGFNGYNFNPGNLQSNVATIPIALSVRNSLETVLYAHHEASMGSHWGISYGLRFTGWVNAGQSFEFDFDQARNVTDTLYFAPGERYSRYRNIEPRLSVRYAIGDNLSVKAGYTRNIQNVHLVSNSVSPFTSLDVSLPSNINIRPQVANMATVGVYKNDRSRGIEYAAEGYYKSMKNQIEYVAHAETLLNPLIERELRFGTGTAYGVELVAKKELGRLRGQVGYSWSRSKRIIPELNEGKAFNAVSDRPHQLTLMVAYDLNLRWNFGVNWNYVTGTPFTSPTGFYRFNDMEVPVYGEKNNDRLPDYHRMDISATYRLNRNPENRYRHTLTFSVYNFYGRKNVLFYNYNKTAAADGSLKVPMNLLEEQYMTSQYYLFRFSPSVSYIFKWK
jgi:hypothetical protein